MNKKTLIEKWEKQINQNKCKNKNLNLSSVNLNELAESLISASQKREYLLKQNKSDQQTEMKFSELSFDKDIFDPKKLDEKCYDSLWNFGLESIKKGQVAVVILAGGQGTRLGCKGPKGMFDIGLPSGKSLFEIFADKIYRLQNLASCVENDHFKTAKISDLKYMEKENLKPVIPLYVMTSELTDKETKQFFSEKNNFGLKKVDFFQQEGIPAIDENYNLIFNKNGNIIKVPDGNGAVFSALKKNGIMTKMKENGVKFIHIMNVDNASAKVADPLMSGLLNYLKCDVLIKVIEAQKKMGLAFIYNNKLKIAEYGSEIALELKQKSNKLFGLIGLYCLSFEFLEKINNCCLIPHLAIKSINKNETKKCLKLEKFIFDAFESAKLVKAQFCENGEYCAVKNADSAGFDNPSKALAKISMRNIALIKENGGIINKSKNKINICEISGRISYNGEGLQFVNGKTFDFPINIQ